MKVSKFLRNSLGMSLVEVMAAVSITGGLSLVVSQLLTNQSQGVKQNEAKSENMNLKGMIQDNLNNTTACAATFTVITAAQWATLAALPSNSLAIAIIRDKNTNPRFSTTLGAPPPLTITGISITNYSSGLQTADLVVQSTFKRSATITQIVKPIKIPINFNFTPAFPAGVSCSTMAIGGEWMLGGNAGTSPGTDYIGTSDAQDVALKTNAVERMRLTTTGNLGIGITTPFTGGNSRGIHVRSGDHSTLVLGDPFAGHGATLQTSDTRHRVFIGANIYDDPTLSWRPYQATKGQAAISFFADQGSLGTGMDFILSTTESNYNAVDVKMNLTPDGSIRMGTSNVVTTTGTNASAMGLENYVNGRYGHAVGYLNTVSAEAGTAFGKGNIASGINSHSVGEANLASGLSSSAHGYYNLASGAYSFASGFYSTASGSSSTALGSTSTASGSSSIAGASGIASGSNSIAFGSGSQAKYDRSVAFLGDSLAALAFAAGINSSAYGWGSVAIGRDARTGAVGTENSTATGLYATAIGPYAIASANNALALSAGSPAGISAIASANNAVAIGQSATASNSQAYAMGYTVNASGSRSMAIGGQVRSSGGSSQAFGSNLHQMHSGVMLGANPWGTTLSRGNFITTIFGPSVDICTAGTIANTGSPEWGAQCDPTATLSISRTAAAPYMARVGIGYMGTAASLQVNCTGNMGFCTVKNDGSNVWLLNSDRRLKDVKSDYTRGLKEILKIKPVYYRYKDNKKLGLTSEKLNIGVVAQDVQPYFPEAVNKDPNGYLVFHSDPITWGTVNAVKELNSKIEKLEKENKDLKEALCELHPELKMCRIK
jgi:type II secretory pathway pseudopilin PulG